MLTENTYVLNDIHLLIILLHDSCICVTEGNTCHLLVTCGIVSSHVSWSVPMNG